MPESAFPPHPLRSYWRRNLRLIALLLALWAGLTFIPSYFARGLSFDFLNWPFSYWMAAYSAPLAYLIIIAVYAGVMNRADRRASLKGTADAVFQRGHPQEFSLRLRRIYVLYTAGFALLILLMALAEILGMPRNWIGYVFLLVTVSLYAGIGIVCRTSDQVEYYVAGRLCRPSTTAWPRRPTGCRWRPSSAWRARST